MSTVVVTTVVVVEQSILVTEVLTGIFAAVASVPLAPVLAGVAIAVGAVAVGASIAAVMDNNSSASNSGANAKSNGGNSRSSSKTKTSSSSSGSAKGNGSGSNNKSGTGNVDEGGAGGGDDGDKDRKGNGRKNQHETNGESKIEEKNKENEPPEENDRVKRRKVTTAWIEIPLYPSAPVKPPRDPSEEKFFIRLKFDKIGRLQSPGENGFYPRQHLLCRCRMLFYGYGRLLKLCKEIGVAVNDLCIFGNSVYKDLRATKVEKLEWIHAAHIFPVTDFDFETIRRRLREIYSNETLEQINSRIQRIENILKNMVGQTDLVHRAFNESGSVGRALDVHLKKFIQEGNGDINMDNVANIRQSLIESLRKYLSPATEREIEETIESIDSTDLTDWINYYNMGLRGAYDEHFNVSRRTIEEDFKEVFKKSSTKDNNKPKGKDEENKDAKKHQ